MNIEIPEINTERTLMRPFTLQDLDDLAAIFSDPDVMRTLPGGKPRTREQALASLNFIQQHWEQHGFGWWAVIHKQNQRLIGWCGLARMDQTSEVEVLYMFARPYWGQGLATETAQASLKYGFEKLRLERIMALAVPENTASRRVMEKIGMQYQGLGHYYNAELAVYSISSALFFTPPATL